MDCAVGVEYQVELLYSKDMHDWSTCEDSCAWKCVVAHKYRKNYIHASRKTNVFKIRSKMCLYGDHMNAPISQNMKTTTIKANVTLLSDIRYICLGSGSCCIRSDNTKHPKNPPLSQNTTNTLQSSLGALRKPKVPDSNLFRHP